MFIIFVSDLGYNLTQYHVTLKTFADDVKLYSVIDGDQRIDNLQFAIDEIYDWSTTWQLPISTSKCHVMDIGPAAKIAEFCTNSLAGTELSLVESARDLGVMFDSNLPFSHHISDIAVKAKIKTLPLFKIFLVGILFI